MKSYSYMDTLWGRLNIAIHQRLERFEDNLVQKVGQDVPDYDGSMVADEESMNLYEAREAYIEALIDNLLGEEEY